MNSEHLQKLSEAESEFLQEGTGNGSLAVHLVHAAADSADGAASDAPLYIGYDIHLENIEALYFEGLKLPRWESIAAESVEEKTNIYNKSLKETTSEYPFISRVSDTDEKIAYSSEEISPLRGECERLLEKTDDVKAVKALQKFHIACTKAAENQSGLLLIPN